MNSTFLKSGVFIYTALLFLINVVFFIWHDSIDTLLAYQHLIVTIIVLSTAIIIAFSTGLFTYNQFKTYSIPDIWVFIFSFLVFIHIKGGYTTVMNDQHLLIYITGVGIYCSIRMHPKHLSDEQPLIYIFLLLLIIEMIFLVMEEIHLLSMPSFSLQALRGSFDNSGKLGYYLAILYPCGLYILLEKGKKSLLLKISLLAGFLLLILFLIFSFSRIAWLSVFVSSFIMATWHLKNKKQRLCFYISTMLIAIVLLSVILLIKKDSASGRMLIWSITANQLGDYKLQGAGYGRFASVYNLWQSNYFSNREVIDRKFYIADNVYFAFNELLQTAVELGWSGALLKQMKHGTRPGIRL